MAASSCYPRQGQRRPRRDHLLQLGARQQLCHPVDPRYGDTLTVTLDTTTLLLHIDGYHRDDYMLPLIGREGNYHCLEISLFRDCLRRNISLRAGKMQSGMRLVVNPNPFEHLNTLHDLL